VCVEVCVVVCCNMLQCALKCFSVYCSVLQSSKGASRANFDVAACVAVFHCVLQSVWQCVTVIARCIQSEICNVSIYIYTHTATHTCCVLQCVAVCCSVLQYVAVCCSALQCDAVYCIVLQCFAMRPYHSRTPMHRHSFFSFTCIAVRHIQCVYTCCSIAL